MKNMSIPEISHEELVARYQKIKPIVEIDNEKYFLREFPVEKLSKLIYTWSIFEDGIKPVNLNTYIPIENSDFECLHTYEYPKYFSPTIAEVLAQIPEKYLSIASAFEMIDSPKTAEDFAKHQKELDNGFHVSTIRLYSK